MNINVDAVNRISLSNALPADAFHIYWMQATDSKTQENFNRRFHHHAFYELHIITSGLIVYGFDNKDVTLCAGQLMVVTPKCRHKVYSHSENVCKISIAFEADNTGVLAAAFEAMANKPYQLNGKICAELDKVLNMCEDSGRYKSELIKLTLYSLVYMTARLSPAKNLQPLCSNAESDDRLFKAKKYIEDNYDVFFTCAEVASYCHISEKQLGRLFRRYENMGLLEYIHQKKLEMSKKLIAEENVSQKQIAEELGFSTVQYFGKFFLRMTGMTPEQYRKNITDNK